MSDYNILRVNAPSATNPATIVAVTINQESIAGGSYSLTVDGDFNVITEAGLASLALPASSETFAANFSVPAGSTITGTLTATNALTAAVTLTALPNTVIVTLPAGSTSVSFNTTLTDARVFTEPQLIEFYQMEFAAGAAAA